MVTKRILVLSFALVCALFYFNHHRARESERMQKARDEYEKSHRERSVDDDTRAVRGGPSAGTSRGPRRSLGIGR